jgi:WD40 repeat protein
MVYSPPHLITAHPNNTMKQYTVIVNDNTLDIAFEQTLYGHTYQVDALAIDAPRRKLLSGDRSCIKIWDLSTGECQVNLGNHKNQSQMDELPPFDIETLGLDEDKIVAVVNCKKKSFIRLWSFNSMLK